jgi:Na+/melibiose symporter-like transporter
MPEYSPAPTVSRSRLILLNTYWLGLSFMWNSLHVLVLPALLLAFVPEERKNTALGILTFSGLIIAMFVQPIAGALSDAWTSRFGRRRPWIAGGTLFDLVFLSTLAVAGGLPLLAIGYIGLQVTSNLAHGPAQGLMHDQVPPQQMGIASGIKNMFDMSGIVVSSLLLGALFDPNRPITAFGWIIGALVVAAMFTLIGVPESVASESATRLSVREALSVDLGSLGGFGQLIVSRLVFLSGIYGVQAFAQYFVRDSLQAVDPIRVTGNLMAAIVITLIVFSIISGFLCDQLGRKRVHVMAAALVAVGCILLSRAVAERTVLLYGSVIGAGIGLFITANWALANDLAPKGQGGKYLGLTNLATAGAGAFSRLAGPGIDALNAYRPGANLGYTGLFLGAAILALTSLFFLRNVPDPAARSRADR